MTEIPEDLKAALNLFESVPPLNRGPLIAELADEFTTGSDPEVVIRTVNDGSPVYSMPLSVYKDLLAYSKELPK